MTTTTPPAARYVFDFSEGSMEMKDLLGGKGQLGRDDPDGTSGPRGSPSPPMHVVTIWSTVNHLRFWATRSEPRSSDCRT